MLWYSTMSPLLAAAHLRHTCGVVLHKHSHRYISGFQQDNHKSGAGGYVFYFACGYRQTKANKPCQTVKYVKQRMAVFGFVTLYLYICSALIK